MSQKMQHEMLHNLQKANHSINIFLKYAKLCDQNMTFSQRRNLVAQTLNHLGNKKCMHKIMFSV